MLMKNSLLFYGTIVSDNLKAAVRRNSRYEAELSGDFAPFAEHYGCDVITTRAYKPCDKAFVEGAVQCPVCRQITQ